MFAFLKQKPGFYKQVVLLAMPIVLQNLITSTLAMADTFMVGLLGELPMAAVALANIPLFMVQMFIFGVQSGATVLFSQYWGKRDVESINRVFGVALYTVLAVASVMAVVLLALILVVTLVQKFAAIMMDRAENKPHNYGKKVAAK